MGLLPSSKLLIELWSSVLSLDWKDSSLPAGTSLSLPHLLSLPLSLTRSRIGLPSMEMSKAHCHGVMISADSKHLSLSADSMALYREKRLVGCWGNYLVRRPSHGSFSLSFVVSHTSLSHTSSDLLPLSYLPLTSSLIPPSDLLSHLPLTSSHTSL